jgi:localization factor PodJL
VRYKRRSQRDYVDDEESIGDDLAAINDRLDELTRHLEGLARSNSRRAASPRDHERERDRDDNSPDRVSDALARLDRRLDQVIAEARNAPLEAQRRLQQSMPLPPPPPPPPPPPAAPNWAAEISARQRVLDGGGATARAIPQHQPQPQAWAAPAPSQDLSALEHQLRQITTQIATLHQPYEDALSALRSDLAEVGRALKEAMPRHAVEALESEIRELSERVTRSRQAGGDPAALSNLETGLAEVRDALRNLAPAENLIGFEDAVRGLSYKIDQLSANAGGPGPDPAVFAQLDEAIAAMRHIGSHVASDGALAQLAAEVHGLATRFEQASHDQTVGSNETLSRLGSRISALMESGRTLPPDLEAVIHALNDRLDRMQLTQGDHLALGGLEDRIVKLVDRLDTYDAKLSNLDAIQRGMTDVLVQLEEMRKSNAARPARSAPVLAEPPTPAEPLPMAPQLTSPPVAAPPAIIAAPAEPALFVPTPPPIVRQPAPPKAAPPPPPRAERRPLDPNLPPDTPLEPGSGVPRSKPGSPAARIAASEAALGGSRPPMPESGGKSAAIAAARNAAMTYPADSADEDAPKRSLFSFFKSRKPKQPKAPKPPKAAKPPKPAKPQKPLNLTDPDAPTQTMRQRVLKQVKTLVIAVSVVIIILGTLQTAMDYFMAPADPSADQSMPAEDRAPDVQPPIQAPATTPARPPQRSMPTPDSLPPTEPMPEPDTTQSINRSMFDPTTVLAPKQQPSANADITGSIGKPAPAQRPTQPATGDPIVNALPSSFGPALRAAAASGDLSAQYEIGHRYAEGTGVARNVEEAIRWFDRAANAGFVPAQFQLAGIYEKGTGVKKDINRARKLYLAAAGKGHAKAMHNLAVLYAEGVDGKPDYRVASNWFRKAAAHGVADSQFNLAVLYARGIGVEQNLAESYKWFALAAGAGDQDAARKRDEVATRLDQQTIMAARLAVQTFSPEREPDDAINVKVPPGGWDRTATAAQPAKPKPRPRKPGAP